MEDIKNIKNENVRDSEVENFERTNTNINANIKSIKSKNKSIRKCPHCHQDMQISIGLNKENMGKLFRMPTLEEWIILFIVIMAIFSFVVNRSVIQGYEIYIEENCTCTHHYANTNSNQEELGDEFRVDLIKELKENGDTETYKG